MDIVVLDHIMFFALMITAGLFILSGIDDLCMDVLYWLHRLYQKVTGRRYKAATYRELKDTPEKKIAVMIPCWQEYLAIGGMLKHNLPRIDYDNYDIFVGTYCNDAKTIEIVQTLEQQFENLHCVISKKPGPTNKADNLNSISKYITEREEKDHIKYDIFVFHDSEDMIHPLEFKYFNQLMPQNQMVQIPIFPLEVKYRHWTHWVYNDEFSEIHTQALVLRESLGGFIPSAGVGTAFTDGAIKSLMAKNQGLPFNTRSLTEDYDAALRLQLNGFKATFLLHDVEHACQIKPWYRPGQSRIKSEKEIVANHALFPFSYYKAVRQRSRWIYGIVLQEWKNVGWQGNFIFRYFLFRDRKPIVVNFIAALGYIILIYWLTVMVSDWVYVGHIVTIQKYMTAYPIAEYLILGTLLLMANRILQRAICTHRVYSMIPAILSVPRIILGNIINIHATIRALLNFFFKNKKDSDQVKWDKTENAFPDEKQLSRYKGKLGDAALERNLDESVPLAKVSRLQEKKRKTSGDIASEV